MNNDYSQKITRLMVSVIAIVVVLPTSFVYAQTTATTPPEESATTTNQLVTPSTAAEQIINNTKTECEQAQFNPMRCVNLVYESPTTVVVNGGVLIFGVSPEIRGFYPNPFLWNAVDGFKAQGYTITDIEMTIRGNRSSDNEFNVIMSK